MSELTRGPAHLLCSVLSLFAGSSDGNFYCLLILGRYIRLLTFKSASYQGIPLIIGPFCSICFLSLFQSTFFPFSVLSVFFRRLFLLQMFLCKLGGLGKIVPLSSVWIEGVYQLVSCLLQLWPSLMFQTMHSTLSVGWLLTPKILVLWEEFLSETAPCYPALLNWLGCIRLENIREMIMYRIYFLLKMVPKGGIGNLALDNYMLVKAPVM